MILEKKLKSVRGLNVPPVAATDDTSARPQPDIAVALVPHHTDVRPIPESEVQNENIENSASDESERTPGTKDDAELDRFYKMLRVGVPLPAVRMKMLSEGVDPDRLQV